MSSVPYSYCCTKTDIISRATGGRPVRFPDLDTAKRVGIDYTVAGAEAINKYLATSSGASNNQ